MGDTDKKNECKRCGRQGHKEQNCFAVYDVNGFEIDPTPPNVIYTDFEFEHPCKKKCKKKCMKPIPCEPKLPC